MPRLFFSERQLPKAQTTPENYYASGLLIPALILNSFNLLTYIVPSIVLGCVEAAVVAIEAGRPQATLLHRQR